MKNLLPLKSLLSFALLVCSTSISANKIISVSDFGFKPDSRINAVPFVQKSNQCLQTTSRLHACLSQKGEI